MMKRVVSVVLFLVMGMGVKAQAPTNVNAGLENGHFVLKWDAVEGAVHYQVYHKEATMPFRLVADTEDTNISDNAYYWPCLDNYYYVVSCFADGSEYESDTVSLSLQAPDFLATDCHGNEIHLYDVLDQGNTFSLISSIILVVRVGNRPPLSLNPIIIMVAIAMMFITWRSLILTMTKDVCFGAKNLALIIQR